MSSESTDLNNSTTRLGDSSVTDSLEVTQGDAEELIIFDKRNEERWIQSDYYFDLEEVNSA